MDHERADRTRLGLDIPYEWWPAPSLLKEIEAAGFGWVQIPSPPGDVLADANLCLIHARAVTRAKATTGLRAVVHGPVSLLAGEPEQDKVFEGLLSYAAEIGAELVVYHCSDLPDAPSSEDRLLAETRSLARHARRAEALGITIAAENLAPVFPRPDRLSHSPMVVRNLVNRISSPALRMCLDVGHANIVASMRHTDLGTFCEPVFDRVALFHLHDNFGARPSREGPPGLDPLRLDLHLAPGRGTLPWGEMGSALVAHKAPLILEIHPPQRPQPAELFEATLDSLGARGLNDLAGMRGVLELTE